MKDSVCARREEHSTLLASCGSPAQHCRVWGCAGEQGVRKTMHGLPPAGEGPAQPCSWGKHSRGLSSPTAWRDLSGLEQLSQQMAPRPRGDVTNS